MQTNKKIWKAIDTQEKTKLNNDIILYNYFQNGQKRNIATLITVVTAKNEIIKRKKLLDAKNEFNWNNENFKQQVLWVINIRLKEYRQHQEQRD